MSDSPKGLSLSEFYKASERARWWTAVAAVVLLALAAQLPSAVEVFGGDDIYVVDNLASSAWTRRLFAFDLDVPAPEYWPWWTGVTFQRRFIRVPSSALLWLEFRLFGRQALPFHLVTSALVAASCLMLLALLARWLPLSLASVASLVPAMHPAASEVVGAINCQPLATAGFFSLLTLFLWTKGREPASVRWLVFALLSCAVAVTSYEAAVFLPLIVVLWDWRLASGLPSAARWGARTRWAPRIGALGVGVVYAPFAAVIRRGLSAPDTTTFRGWAEFGTALRLDTVEYVFKTVGLFQPTAPWRYWLDSVAGEWAAAAAALALLAGAVWLTRRSRTGAPGVLGPLGVVGFALFLAPPLLTRAGFSRLNFPLLRQLYLPVLLGMPFFVGAMLLQLRRRWLALAVSGVWIACLVVESALAGGWNELNASRAVVARGVERLLHDVPAEAFVVAVGDGCNFAPSLIRAGPSAWLIPDNSQPAALELTSIDEHTVIARLPKGFDIPVQAHSFQREAGANRGPGWVEKSPPPLLRDGWQRISGATVAVEERNSTAVTALRYRFDLPLSETVFLKFRGCSTPERVTLTRR